VASIVISLTDTNVSSPSSSLSSSLLCTRSISFPCLTSHLFLGRPPSLFLLDFQWMTCSRILFMYAFHRSTCSSTLSSVALNPTFPFTELLKISGVTGCRSNNVSCLLFENGTVILPCCTLTANLSSNFNTVKSKRNWNTKMLLK
jgi:hypothetical protein